MERIGVCPGLSISPQAGGLPQGPLGCGGAELGSKKLRLTMDGELITAIAAAAQPLETYEPLLNAIGDSRFVLLGEATHGTEEFYEIRVELTRRLVSERGFSVVLIEGEWPAAYRLNRYIGATETTDTSAVQAVSGFTTFPKWMWSNPAIVHLADTLRAHNVERRARLQDHEAAASARDEFLAAGATEEQLKEAGIASREEIEAASAQAGRPVSMYGLDVYSVQMSARAVVEFLEVVDPDAAALARERYSVLTAVGGVCGAEEEEGSMHTYGRRVALGDLKPMAEEIQRNLLATLGDLQRQNREAYSLLMSPADCLSAEQNAEVVVNGEAYFRGLYEDGSVATWNLRDQHCARGEDNYRCPATRT